ncbi:AraC family transcriptional regulator [Saccharibacillus sp. CPCC 101409]|uniref:AraC family transcriptional regulator n=1 Tax=Saccharibacillus sp. CPCC 101409 TaxID=3058041 RepID=UPI002672908C|nr:AraC family transcriptional regulator [Saccharibacillus sp. CPCC 101409]MDO3412474.1 AraC family transcriptional regulator [Saccharibacillus sp. CPCC 101409]
MKEKAKAGFYENHAALGNRYPFIFHRWELNRPGDGFAAHWHTNMELLYITEGEASVTINAETVRASRGDVVVIDSNAIHSLVCERSVTYSCLIIDHHFCAAHGLDYTSSSFPLKTDHPAVRQSLEQLLAELSASADDYHYNIAQSLTLTLTGMLLRHALRMEHRPAEASGPSIELVKGAIRFIERHYQEPLSIDDICNEVKVSKYHFCRLFKALTGQTVNKYVNNLRCERAKVLIAGSTLPIAECGLRSGFNDPSYFAKCYKRRFGYMPSREKRGN